MKIPTGCGSDFCQKHIRQIRQESRDGNGNIMGTAHACMCCEACQKEFYKKVGSFMRCCTLATILMPIVLSLLMILIVFASTGVGIFSRDDDN